MKEEVFFVLRVELLNVRSLIWRLIQVPETLTLDELHAVIQGAMGWHDTHCHEFTINGIHYEMGDLSIDPLPEGTRESSHHTVGAICAETREFQYLYDFGDRWLHNIQVVRTVTPAPWHNRPRCIAGGGACPPEDSGGPDSYDDYALIAADPFNSKYDHIQKMWPGFHPDIFSTTQADTLVAAAYMIALMRKGKSIS